MTTKTKLNSNDITKDITTTTEKLASKKVAKSKKKAVKKAAPKKKAKKVSAKKTTSKTVRKSTKKQISPEQHFYLNDGRSIKDIKELAKMMDELSDELFYHHVNDERHDFANWINNIFEEAELSRQLMEAEKNKEKNHYIVLKYVIKGK